jgi:arylsulfatase A-like enzyme
VGPRLQSPHVAANIVLVVMDTARADAFEPWGAAVGSTPAVAQLARNGGGDRVVRSTANWTVPGHASMFTGELPRTLGLGQVPGDSMNCTLQINAVLDRWLPEVLRRNGYATSAVSANLWISAQSGFDAGFDTFEHVESARKSTMGDTGLRARLGWARDAMRARSDAGALAAEQCLARWLSATPGQPFFWFVNLTECHSPYLPPRPYNDLSLLGRLRAGDESRTYLNLESIWKTSLGANEIPAEVLDRMGHLYRRSVTFMDDWVARLLQRLDDHALLDDTVVIVTSDHGENLGECGLIGHCFSLDDRLLHVPFVTSAPTFPSIASLADLPGALAQVTGLHEHPWALPSASGPIAVAQMEALATLDVAQPVIDEWGLDAHGTAMVTTSSTCAVEGSVKLIRRDDGHETLFLLDSDPLEQSPVTAHAPAVDRSLVDRLRRSIQVADAQVSRRVFFPSAPTDDHAETERITKKMRELGYL